MTNLISALMLLVIVSSSALAQTGVSTFENANRGRTDQSYIEDSAHVFFAEYPNPFSDRSFVWFWCFEEGDVELSVHDALTDSVEAVYVFARQDGHYYSLAVHATDPSRIVRCVVLVNGRAKCSKQFGRWIPTADRQGQRSKYTIQSQ